MPLPLSVKVSPAGSVPVSVIAGVGEPVVVIATDPGLVQGEVGGGRAGDGRGGGRVHRDGERSVAVLPEALVAEIVTG